MTDILPEEWTSELQAACPSTYKYKYKYKLQCRLSHSYHWTLIGNIVCSLSNRMVLIT